MSNTPYVSYSSANMIINAFKKKKKKKHRGVYSESLSSSVPHRSGTGNRGPPVKDGSKAAAAERKKRLKAALIDSHPYPEFHHLPSGRVRGSPATSAQIAHGRGSPESRQRAGDAGWGLGGLGMLEFCPQLLQPRSSRCCFSAGPSEGSRGRGRCSQS